MRPYSAFAPDQLIAEGDLRDVALACKKHVDSDPNSPVFIFNNETSRVTEVDLRGDEAAILNWLDQHYPQPTEEKQRGRGRPKLGVVSREITLLPRHWEWLAQQRGGASVTLRRLVDIARKDESKTAHHAQDLTYAFSVVMAGDRPGFEEAMRALYAKDKGAFRKQIKGWPKAIQRHADDLADAAWE